MMTRKTQKAYEHALKYINENVFSLQCETIITDYESAMRQAIRNVVPGVKLLGCWFHYAQAIRRKFASISELFELIRTNENISTIYYKFICLALLPHDKIERAFNELALEALQMSETFTPFIRYFQNQWLKRVGPKKISVFLEETRTTCAAEGYNGKLGKTFQKHPNFFVFVESLQWEELAKSNALEQHINGAKQTQPKKEYRERSAQIREESIKFEIPNKTNSQLFLNRIVNIRNRMLPKEFENFQNIIRYEDEDEEFLDDMNVIAETRQITRSKKKETSENPDNSNVVPNEEHPIQIRKTARSKKVMEYSGREGVKTRSQSKITKAKN